MIRRRTLFWLVVGCYALTGLYFVQPDEQVIVRRFGAVLERPREPGAQWGLPWALDRIDRLRSRETKRVSLGAPDTATGVVATGATQLLTGDRNLVNVRATVQYTVSDAAAFLFSATNVETIIRTSAEAILTEALAVESVEHALTAGKRELAIRAAERLQALVDTYGLGITVRSFDLAAVEPPAEVAESFDQVTSALRQREQSIHEAHGYEAQTHAAALSSAQRELDQAKAFRDRTVAAASGAAQRFASLLVEYRQQPTLTSTRMYLEAMTEILPRLRSKLIVDPGHGLDISILREDAAPRPASK